MAPFHRDSPNDRTKERIMFHRALRSERGAAAVEMALMLPVLILLIGGIVDFGRAYYTQIMLTNAAREGARAAVDRKRRRVGKECRSRWSPYH